MEMEKKNVSAFRTSTSLKKSLLKQVQLKHFHMLAKISS